MPRAASLSRGIRGVCGWDGRDFSRIEGVQGRGSGRGRYDVHCVDNSCRDASSAPRSGATMAPASAVLPPRFLRGGPPTRAGLTRARAWPMGGGTTAVHRRRAAPRRFWRFRRRRLSAATVRRPRRERARPLLRTRRTYLRHRGSRVSSSRACVSGGPHPVCRCSRAEEERRTSRELAPACVWQYSVATHRSIS